MLIGTRVPLWRLLHPTGSESLKAVMKQCALDAEKNHHDLRRNLVIIEHASPDSNLKNFILNVIKDDLNYITPLESVVEMANVAAKNNEDLWTNNINLYTAWGIKYTFIQVNCYAYA
jgi:hypothetical protein